VGGKAGGTRNWVLLWFSEIFAYATSVSSFRTERVQMLAAASLLAKQHPYVVHNAADDDACLAGG